MRVMPRDLTVRYVRSMGASVHVSLVLKDVTAVDANQASTISRSADVHVSILSKLTAGQRLLNYRSWLIKMR